MKLTRGVPIDALDGQVYIHHWWAPRKTQPLVIYCNERLPDGSAGSPMDGEINCGPTTYAYSWRINGWFDVSSVNADVPSCFMLAANKMEKTVYIQHGILPSLLAGETALGHNNCQRQRRPR